MEYLENLFNLNDSAISSELTSESLSGGKPSIFKTRINLTDKTNGKTVKVISDYEGQNLPKAKDGEHYIICGDMLDSTVSVGSTFDTFKTKIGTYQKEYNIRNILKIVYKPDN